MTSILLFDTLKLHDNNVFRNQENLTDFEVGDVEYETIVLISELRDNPAYAKYYTFITR